MKIKIKSDILKQNVKMDHTIKVAFLLGSLNRGGAETLVLNAQKKSEKNPTHYCYSCFIQNI